MTEPCELSAVEARALIGEKKLSATELAQEYLAAIEAGNPAINAYITLDKAATLIEAAAAANHPLKAVLFLSVSEAVAHERFVASREDETRGERADDAEHILATRFTEFRDKTLPVIESYREKGMLIEVDGNPPKDEVHQTILRGLLRLAQNA